jgi:hypothetical protein
MATRREKRRALRDGMIRGNGIISVVELTRIERTTS